MTDDVLKTGRKREDTEEGQLCQVNMGTELRVVCVQARETQGCRNTDIGRKA